MTATTPATAATAPQRAADVPQLALPHIGSARQQQRRFDHKQAVFDRLVRGLGRQNPSLKRCRPCR